MMIMIIVRRRLVILMVIIGFDPSLNINGYLNDLISTCQAHQPTKHKWKLYQPSHPL
jgi:hypothetical protein